MIEEQKTQPARDWIFRGFLVGVALGFVIGALTQNLDANPKGNPQIWLAFCAIATGLFGLAAGVVHRLIRRQ